MEEAAREMTLLEYINNLHESHLARSQFRTIQEALVWAEEMFKARDEMNSKVHCAPVRYSPITDRVSHALALLRSQNGNGGCE